MVQIFSRYYYYLLWNCAVPTAPTTLRHWYMYIFILTFHFSLREMRKCAGTIFFLVFLSQLRFTVWAIRSYWHFRSNHCLSRIRRFHHHKLFYITMEVWPLLILSVTRFNNFKRRVRTSGKSTYTQTDLIYYYSFPAPDQLLLPDAIFFLRNRFSPLEPIIIELW